MTREDDLFLTLSFPPVFQFSATVRSQQCEKKIRVIGSERLREGSQCCYNGKWCKIRNHLTNELFSDLESSRSLATLFIAERRNKS